MPVSLQTIRRERATIEDVAASAGVSVATVSRGLRGLPNVASHTRERIERIATELDYRADPAASRLAAGRSRAIAVAVPMLDGWYFSHVVAGVEAVFAEAGYDTIVVGLGAYGAGRPVLEAAGPIYRRVDGLICVDAALNDDEFVRLRSEGMAIVYIGPDGPGVPSLGIDDVEVGRLATSHLLELGHRRIGVVNGQPEDGSVAPFRRQQGFELAFKERGLQPDPSLYAPGYFDIGGGYDALGMLLWTTPTRRPRVFAFSDEMAFGVLWAARRARSLRARRPVGGRRRRPRRGARRRAHDGAPGRRRTWRPRGAGDDRHPHRAGRDARSPERADPACRAVHHRSPAQPRLTLSQI